MNGPGDMAPRYERVQLTRTQPSVALGDEVIGPPIVLAASTNDNPNSDRTTAQKTRGEFPEGDVVCRKSGATTFVEANDPNRAAFGAPAVASAEAPDADWASKTVKLFVNGAEVASVALGAGDDTTAEVVAALAGDTDFAAHATPSGANGNPLVVTGLRAGADQSIRVHVNLSTAFADSDGSTGSEASAAGTDPDFRVLGDKSIGKRQDTLENADAPAGRNYVGGVFDASKLVNLTGEARAAMSRSGFRFVN